MQEQPDKLLVDLSWVINCHPGKGLGLGLSVTYCGDPQSTCRQADSEKL